MRHLFGFLFLFLIFQQNSGADAAGNKLVSQADKFRGLVASFSSFTRVVSQDGQEKTDHTYSVKVKEKGSVLVEQIFPERARGRKLLMKDLDMWLYTPQLKKSIRVNLQQKLTGEVSNGDISRTNFAGDYDATILKRDDKAKAVVLELLATDKRVTYNKIHYWVENKTSKPIKAEFFALSGRLLKTAAYSDFKKVGKQEIMHRVVIHDALVSTKRSILTYSKFKIEKFSDSLFNKEQMDQ